MRHHEHNLSLDYSFEGFQSRFLRRKLVWLSEEAAGRVHHVHLQKRDALDVYLRCLKHRSSQDSDTVKMQSVMKEHRKVLCSGLSRKQRLLFVLSVYAPKLYRTLFAK